MIPQKGSERQQKQWKIFLGWLYMLRDKKRWQNEGRKGTELNICILHC